MAALLVSLYRQFFLLWLLPFAPHRLLSALAHLCLLWSLLVHAPHHLWWWTVFVSLLPAVSAPARTSATAVGCLDGRHPTFPSVHGLLPEEVFRQFFPYDDNALLIHLVKFVTGLPPVLNIGPECLQFGRLL